MESKKECQLPCLPNVAEGFAKVGPQPLINRMKRTFARPWNYYIKKKVWKFSDLLFTLFAGTLTKPKFVSSQSSCSRLMAKNWRFGQGPVQGRDRSYPGPMEGP
jgi:hypothetical protein